MTTTVDYRQTFRDLKCCIVVTSVNNAITTERLLDEIKLFTDDIIIIDSISASETKNIIGKFKNIEVISYPENKGKGYLLRQLFSKALEMGFDYAITIDSNSNYSAADLIKFITTLKNHPGCFIIGARNIKENGIPGKSSISLRFSNFRFYVMTVKKLPDTKSGYRLYPVLLLKDFKYYSNKYGFEIEVLVRASWKNIKIINIPVTADYTDRHTLISYFRPFGDFLHILLLDIILVIEGYFYRLPVKFIKNLTRKNIGDFFKKKFIYCKDSNLKITLSVMLGIFISVFPIWGWQFLSAVVLAHFLRLNKVITGITVNQSIPPLIPFFLYLSYVTGGIVLGSHRHHIGDISSFNFDFVKKNFYQYVIGTLVFGSLMSIFYGLITFILLKIFREKIIRREAGSKLIY